MILYNSNYFGILQLGIVSGSAVYRTLLPCLCSSAVFTFYWIVLQNIPEDYYRIIESTGLPNDEAKFTVHPFVISIYIMAFSLVITHRLNYCYQRYWEACSNVFMMHSKWMDSATHLAAYHYQSKVYEDDRPPTFGDQDTPLEELHNNDAKNKSGSRKRAPRGGNNRNADITTHYPSITTVSEDDDSETSGDSASSSIHLTVSGSHKSFISRSSRERFRSSSSLREGETITTLNDVKPKPSSGGAGDYSLHSLRHYFSWGKSNSKKKLLDSIKLTIPENPRRRGSLFKRNSSAPDIVKSRSTDHLDLQFSLSDRTPTSKNNKSNASSPDAIDERAHRRLPSTDIPIAKIGEGQVKSFKPNKSLAWQKRNQSALPRNTGLHATLFQAAVAVDFVQLLRQEEQEKERQKRKTGTWEQQIMGTTTDAATGESVSSSRRAPPALPRRRSFHNYLTPRFSNANSIKRNTSEPYSGYYSSDDDSMFSSGRDPSSNAFSKRVKLHNLPSIYKESETQLELALKVGNKTMVLPEMDHRHHKMNGRASLFLQEAAHLYSLMSAVAMASLRADMEGVSSPLIEYIPGKKFPPVNPEEVEVRVVVEEEKVKNKTNHPNQQNERVGLRVRLERNNTLYNAIRFLFGLTRDSRQRTTYNASRPFCVLGGISDNEVEMLRKVRGHSAQHALCCLWLREFITREYLDGSTGNVAPPIIARTYQHLSDGTQQYNNCRKTAFTDFPFPHAQLTSFIGFVSVFIIPLLYYTYVNGFVFGLLLNFLSLGCFFGIQEVANELEEPFIRYPNDLPLNNYQVQFNEALISSLFGGFHPDAWGDAIDNGGVFHTSPVSNPDKMSP